MKRINVNLYNMKTLKRITVQLLCMGLLFGATSCVVFSKHDNGKHKGWVKNSNNPHHPNSTNPGKSKGNSKK
jgi:ABC-type oligopeptide transport system substrate-binding subunit